MSSCHIMESLIPSLKYKNLSSGVIPYLSLPVLQIHFSSSFFANTFTTAIKQMLLTNKNKQLCCVPNFLILPMHNAELRNITLFSDEGPQKFVKNVRPHLHVKMVQLFEKPSPPCISVRPVCQNMSG